MGISFIGPVIGEYANDADSISGFVVIRYMSAVLVENKGGS